MTLCLCLCICGSGWGPVALADFKSVALPPARRGVGSTPSRSRHISYQRLPTRRDSAPLGPPDEGGLHRWLSHQGLAPPLAQGHRHHVPRWRRRGTLPCALPLATCSTRYPSAVAWPLVKASRPSPDVNPRSCTSDYVHSDTLPASPITMNEGSLPEEGDSHILGRLRQILTRIFARSATYVRRDHSLRH